MPSCVLCTPSPPPIATGLLPHEVAFIGQALGTFLAVLIAVGVLLIIATLSLLIVRGTKD